jgi:hypothetical protein
MKSMTHRVRKPAALIAATIAGAAASSTQAQFNFAATANAPAGTQPGGLAAGDFNGDGFIDLATSTDNPDAVSILVNDGSGNFALGFSIPLPNSSSPDSLAAGDFDGDGDDDLIVVLRDRFVVRSLLQTSPGVFDSGGDASVGDRARGIDIADIDADGDLDAGVANRDGNSVTILVNNGGGGFAPTTYPVGQEPRAVAFGDFDGDGDGDVAVTEHDDRSVRILINTNNNFASGAVLAVNPTVRPEGIDAADLDGDGDVDLAVATSDNDLGINTASIFVNNGGTFSGPTAYALGGSSAGSIVAADFDCDGDMDIAAANEDSATMSLIANVGNATFGAAMQLPAGATPEAITATDLDGDGDADLATANRDSNSVSVARNDTCDDPGVPGDLDGDGDVDQADLGILLSCYNQTDCGDLDGDGDTDQADLGILLANYGT